MAVDFRLYLITDRRQAPGGDIVSAVERALAGGVRAVQLREKDLGGRELHGLARAMRDRTARYGAKLLVNDRVDVALAVGADGVHLGVASMPPRDARALLGAAALIGCSAHSAGEVAEADGADFVTFGPVYATPSKARYGPPVGVDALREACAAARVPVFALGGVGARNAGEAVAAGAAGVAAISAIVAAADPAAAAAELDDLVGAALAARRKGKGGTP